MNFALTVVYMNFALTQSRSAKKMRCFIGLVRFVKVATAFKRRKIGKAPSDCTAFASAA